MRTMGVMASDTLNSGTRRTTFFVLILFLLSSVPLVPNVSADEGIPEELQAQDISAIFDAVSCGMRPTTYIVTQHQLILQM
jgi:hypothetical protein